MMDVSTVDPWKLIKYEEASVTLDLRDLKLSKSNYLLYK